MKMFERFRKWLNEPSIEKPETHTLSVLGFTQNRQVSRFGSMHDEGGGKEVELGPINSCITVKSSLTGKEVTLSLTEEQFNALFTKDIEFADVVTALD